MASICLGLNVLKMTEWSVNGSTWNDIQYGTAKSIMAATSALCIH